MSVLVLGATGGVGGEVVKQLVSRGVQVTGAVRDVNKARNQLPPEASLVQADFDDATSLQQAAVHGKSVKAFVYFTPNISKVLQSLKAGGVQHVVFLSSCLVDLPLAPNAIKDWHADAEKAIVAAGFTFTFLRPDYFSSNPHTHWQHGIALNGIVKTPYADAPVSVIAIEDIAAVAVQALTSHQLDNQTVNLIGSEVLSSREQVAIVAEVLGKRITVQNLSEADHLEAAEKAGFPMPIVKAGLVYAKWRSENGGEVQASADKTVKGVMTLREYTLKHRAAFEISQ